MTERHIVAGSGGFISKDGYHLQIGPILKYALALTNKDTPRFAYIGTATGDDSKRIAGFYHACANEPVSASHLQLFPLPNQINLEEYILSQDIIWVGGGSVANMLAVWREHRLDHILKKAWEKGIILTGVSAGAICWSMGGTTDSFGVDLKAFNKGLGMLPYSCGVHYDSETRRRPLFEKLIQNDELPEGYATDDGVNLHFIGTKLHKAISDTSGKFAYHVHKNEDGSVVEDIIEPELLK